MKKTLTFISALLMWTGLQAETVKTKEIDGGGTGTFKAVAVKDDGMPDFTIYRPKDLLHAHAREGALPVLMWGNGACLDSSIDYERFLTEIASHGYIVMAIGEMQDTRDDRKAGHSESAELKRGLDWLVKQAGTKGSEYHNNIDTLKIAAAGHSCGGAQVLANAADPRLKTCLIMNAGMGDIEMAGASRESLPRLHMPMLYVTGGPDDIAYHNARKDVERISHVPVALADHPASGHGGTYGQPNGGDYARLAIDWLDWQLKGKNDNSATFLDGEAKGYDGWTITAKNFVDFQSFKPLWIMNGDRQIYGELFTPQGESKGIMIVSHGFNGSHQFGRNYFDLMQELGYQCYVFDFPCGSVGSRSDNNTLNMSIPDEQSDLRAIVNYFSQQNPDQEIILLGESQGGLISALTAAQMKDDISKLVLVFPALCIPDNWRARYPNLSDIPEVTDLWGVRLGRRFFEEIHDMKPLDIIGSYRGPVLIVQGDKDPIVSMADSEKARDLYKNARLHVIPEAGHGFNPTQMKELKEQMLQFIKE